MSRGAIAARGGVLARSSDFIPSTLSGSSHGACEAPTFPVGDAGFLRAQSGASDVHAEDLAGVGHEKLAGPLGKVGSPFGDGIFRIASPL